MHTKTFRALFTRDVLLYVVFLTGAVVLAVEVMAVRMLAPYFGNTIYTFSSVLSVILAALSLGYWQGGRMADREQTHEKFYAIVTRAGWAVIIMQLASVVSLGPFSIMFSLVTGPLIASMVLFFYPSYLFGLLSPYVIRLRTDALPVRGVGTISGEVFFASTLGSIIGSLVSGFLLVPLVGVSTSLFMAGYLTLLIGMFGHASVMQQSGVPNRARYIKVCISAVAVLLVIGVFRHTVEQVTRLTTLPEGTVHILTDGVYSRIAVIDTMRYQNIPGRVLLLDRTFSSGVQLPNGELLFPYTEYYRLYRVFLNQLERALVLGAGTGTYATALHSDYPTAQIDIVDTEPLLFDYAYTYFFMPHTSRIVSHVADGRHFLRTSSVQYDLILGDMYSQIHAVPWHVSTVEYYRELYAHLNDGGVYIANHIGSLADTTPSLFWSSVRTLHEVFGAVAIYAVTSADSDTAQNLMLVARKQGSLDELNTLATFTDAQVSLFGAHRVSYEPERLAGHAVYTDDLAPLELYAARMSSEQ